MILVWLISPLKLGACLRERRAVKMTVKNCVKSRHKVESVGQRYQNKTVDKLNYDWLLYFNPGPRVCLTLFRLRASVWCEEVGSRPGRFAKFPVFFSVRLPLPGFPAKDCAKCRVYILPWETSPPRRTRHATHSWLLSESRSKKTT